MTATTYTVETDATRPETDKLHATYLVRVNVDDVPQGFVMCSDAGGYAEFMDADSAQEKADELNEDDSEYLARFAAGFPARN